jgi:hypothetical protein
MKRSLPFIFFCALFASSCGNGKQEEQHLTTETDTVGIADGYAGSNDTLHIDEPVLLITWPDSLMQEQLKSVDSEEFYIVADDYGFYNAGLMQVADSLGITNISTSLRYIDFTMTNGKHFLLDRNPEDRWWGDYLFDGIKEPDLYLPGENDKDVLKKYFGK